MLLYLEVHEQTVQREKKGEGEARMLAMVDTRLTDTGPATDFEAYRGCTVTRARSLSELGFCSTVNPVTPPEQRK